MQVGINDVIRATAHVTKISRHEILSYHRGAKIWSARRLAMLIARVQCNASKPELAREFGRSLESVREACLRAREMIEECPFSRADHDAIIETLSRWHKKGKLDRQRQNRSGVSRPDRPPKPRRPRKCIGAGQEEGCDEVFLSAGPGHRRCNRCRAEMKRQGADLVSASNSAW